MARPQRSASIQPVTPGRMRAQVPSSNAGTRKVSAQLEELDERKLEGDPLTLNGNGIDPAVIGAAPVAGSNDPSTSIGDRLILYRSDQGSLTKKCALGVDADGTLWMQANSGLGASGSGGFDWYGDGTSSISVLRRMRMTPTGDLRIGSTGEPNSRLDVDGPVATSYLATVASGAISASVTEADATGGAITLDLPTAIGIAGRRYSIKRVNAGANNVVVDASGAQTIDGALTKTLASQYACIEIVSNGANWIIVAQMGTVT